MLKGTQRKLIVMTTRESPLFETAYFILKPEAESRRPAKNEMLCEATRILEENAVARKVRKLGKKHLLIAFSLGFLLGGLLALLLLLR